MTYRMIALAGCVLAAMASWHLPHARGDIYQWEWDHPDYPWAERQESSTLAPDGAGGVAVPGANLSGLDLYRAWLPHADLNAADLSQANLSDAYLAGTKLFGANLRSVNLHHAHIYATDLTAADLSQAKLTGTYLRDVNLSDANLRGANLEHAISDYVAFAGTDLEDSRIEFSSYFRGPSFSPSQLASTASFKSKSLRGVTGLAGLDLRGFDLSDFDLTGTSFNSRHVDTQWSSRLSEVNLKQAEIEYANFAAFNWFRDWVFDPVLEPISMQQIISTSSYQKGRMRGVNLSGIMLNNADFSYMELTEAVLTGADLEEADLRSAVLQDARIATTFYNGVDEFSTIVDGANFSAADLRGAAFLQGDYWGSDRPGGEPVGAHALPEAQRRNTILPDGSLDGLRLGDGDLLVIRNDHRRPDRDDSGELQPAIPIRVGRQFIVDGGALRLLFDAEPWDSLISFEPYLPIEIDGVLELAFDSDVAAASQVGRKIKVFDWTHAAPRGEFNLASYYQWDTADLYTSGEIRFLGLPSWPSGDFDNNGQTNGHDLLAWQRLGVAQEARTGWEARFGTQSPAELDALAIPEPSSVAAVVLTATCLSACRSRRRNPWR